MTSQILALYGSILLAAVCIIGVYVICASNGIGLRCVTVTPLEPQVLSRSDDIQCSTYGTVLHLTLAFVVEKLTFMTCNITRWRGFKDNYASQWKVGHSILAPSKKP